MRGKREFVARACSRTGITKVLESLPQRPVLIILNYHRVGHGADTPYDSGTFSATPEELDSQLAYLKRRFNMATLETTLDMLTGDAPRRTSVLITFDDGYLDNYTLAFPILRKHGVEGVFFLPTAFVGTGKLPWWDAIAYMIKKSRKKSIALDYPHPATFDLANDGAALVSMRILHAFIQPAVKDPTRFIADLEKACETARPESSAERLFLSWEEAREMQRGGMAFGSHTDTHEVLSKLSPERQREEVFRSREILERELDRPIDALAYPVGQQYCFSADTVEALKQTGYRAAFSFYGGLNRPGEMQPFDIRRYSVGDQSYARLRLQTALAAVSGTRWF
ncbi:MAG TPA: polysaccharide deacetylase family protein [Bryobacteraceae bacterium]|nr:polysaccharide deacetylase family protein [Bryobacteraceae bacterium]